MAGTLGSLNVVIGADTSSLNSGIRKATMGMAAVATAAAAAGVAMTKFTATVADNAKELRNQAKLANTATSDFQKMAFAARSVGIQQDKLSDILKDVNDRVGDFMSSGGGEMQDFFENIAPKVGVTAKQFKNLSGAQALQLYVSSLEKANLSQAEMTFYMEAMANDSTALLPLLKNNGVALGEMGERAEELGLIMSELDLAKLEDFSRVSQEINGRLEAIGNQIGSALAPYIATLGETFLGAAEDADAFGDLAEKSMMAAAVGVGMVADAVEVVVRTFQLAGNSVAGFVLAVQTGMLQAATTITRGPIDRINYLIELLNSIPGAPKIELIDQPDFVKQLEQMKRTAELAYAESTQDFMRILNQPMPSDAIDEFMDNVNSKTVELAENASKARAALAGLGNGAGGGSGGGNAGGETVGSTTAATASAGIAGGFMSATSVGGIADPSQLAAMDTSFYAQQLEMVTNLSSEAAMKLAELHQAAQDPIQSIMDDMTDIFTSLDEKMGETLGNAIANGTSLKDAFAEVGQEVLSSVVGSLIQVATQMALNAALSSALQSSQATQAAATGASMTASYAPAAATASIASFGGAAAAGLAGMAAALPQMLGLVSGGRQFGGAVSAGKNYEVNETGRPEILSTGGKQFLTMPQGQSGQVTPLSGTGSGSNVNVIVNNNAAGTEATATEGTDADGQRTVTIAVNKVAEQIRRNTGAVASALNSSTDIKRKTR